MTEIKYIEAQEGPQRDFCASSADIVFYGGSAGSGKTWSLLFESTRNIANPGYRALLLRKTTPELRMQGGLWDESTGMYPVLGGKPREHVLNWRFPSGSSISFSGLQYESDLLKYQGGQFCMLGFDQIEHFKDREFWYMISRNRSVCGVKPYVRANCNPDPDSFVRELIDWWLDEEGYPIPERSGVIRYFLKDGDHIEWADDPDEFKDRAGDESILIKSFTFIAAKLSDNPALTSKDPGYEANLNLLSYVDRKRLKDGNWNIRPAPGLYFRDEFFEIIDYVPKDIVISWVRAWDRAATKPHEKNKNPDWSIGVLMGKTKLNRLIIADVERFRDTPGGTEERIARVAAIDGKRVKIGFWQDPGAGGKSDNAHYVKDVVPGYTVKSVVASKDKETYAKPASSQAEHGNISVVQGPWNKPFFNVLRAFPGKEHDDDVDALSLAVLILTTGPQGGKARAWTSKQDKASV